MKAVKRLGLGLTIALAGAACGDDDNGTIAVDSGIQPATGTDAGGSGSGSDSGSGGSGGDAAARPCTTYTPVSGDKCGGSHCLETEAELKASATANATCGGDVEIKSFCSLQAVTAATSCTSMAALGGADPTQATFSSTVATCATPLLPAGFSSNCLNCFVESGRCAAINCLSECIVPTSPGCDSCRINKGCISSFYTCAGIPDPLD